MGLSEELFDRAVKVIPGGVNSPVRAYGAIGIAPRFIDRADGCHIYDVDGKEYVDYIDSWGPMILGHNFPEVKESVLKACEKGLSFGCATAIEVEMAEFICDHIPHVDMVRMVNSGTSCAFYRTEYYVIHIQITIRSIKRTYVIRPLHNSLNAKCCFRP